MNKRLFAGVIAACLTLCGCSRQAAPPLPRYRRRVIWWGNRMRRCSTIWITPIM